MCVPAQGNASGKPASPEPLFPQENTCAFSLELPNAENRTGWLMCSPSRGALESAALISRGGLSSNYPLPSGLLTANQQCRELARWRLPRACRLGRWSRQLQIWNDSEAIGQYPQSPPPSKERFVLWDSSYSIPAESCEQADA